MREKKKRDKETVGREREKECEKEGEIGEGTVAKEVQLPNNQRKYTRPVILVEKADKNVGEGAKDFFSLR